MRNGLFVLAWFPGLCMALGIDLLVAKDQQEPIERFLSSQLPTMIELRILSHDGPPDGSNDWLIAVGDDRIAWAQKYQDQYDRIILFHVSEQALKAAPPIQNSYALVMDQPLQRQQALARVLFPKDRRLAVVIGADTGQTSNLPTIVVGTGPHWQQELSQQMLDHDVLLISEQSMFYQTSVAHAVLLTAYRQRKPVIGPGERYVEAGAMASCYTTLGQYLDQLVAIVNALQTGDNPPPIQYPRLFQVITNRPVVRSMALSLPDDAELTRQVRTSVEMSP